MITLSSRLNEWVRGDVTFIVYAKYGKTKDALQEGAFTAAFAKDWEEARSQAINFLRGQGYRIVYIETIQEVEAGKQPWEK